MLRILPDKPGTAFSSVALDSIERKRPGSYRGKAGSRLDNARPAARIRVMRHAALAICLMLVTPTVDAASLRVIDTARNDVLNVREYPSVAAPIVGFIPPDGRGIAHDGEFHENWLFVRYRGVRGWVSRRFVAPDDPPVGQGR